MKKLFFTFGISACLFLAINSCKKTVDPVETPKPTTVLCDGNGSTSYYPIALKNNWTYIIKRAGVLQTVKEPKLEIPEMQTFFLTKKYYTMADSQSGMYGASRYYRIDSTNGNLLYFNPSYADEYIEVPGAPVQDQKWNYIFWSKQVTNLNASVKTDYCSYTGLLEITMFDGTTVKETSYYKKGIGLVYKKVPNPTMASEITEYMLKTISIK